MRPTIRCRFALAAVFGALLTVVPPAAGHTVQGSGAVAAPSRPVLDTFRCDTGAHRSCPRGELLAVRGEGLETVEAVVFLGHRGSEDNRTAAARRRSAHRLLVQIPDTAHSGPLRGISRMAGRSHRSRRLRIVKATPPEVLAPTVATDGAFPVRGSYDFGTATNRFGGGRGHQGQDVFADCGTGVVAARAGEVTQARYQSRAGHFVVIDADDGTSQVYMHMRRRPLVQTGQRVDAGTTLGAVGQSGAAHGCHLHFELWTAPGWYDGGQPVDPLPTLRRWSSDG